MNICTVQWGMRRDAMRCGIALVLFAAATAARGQSPATSAFSGERAARVEATVEQFRKETNAPGIAVAVVENGQYLWSKGFGSADVRRHTPVTPQTLFRLASVSKPITAAGAMQLWEQGKLDLDAPIQNYCRQFPEKPYPITTRELLGHLGGIRHYKSESKHDAELSNTKHFSDPIAGGIQFFAKDALVETPGTKFHYSTQGYTLVGCAIQTASRESYVDYIMQNVFAAAGMTHSQVDDSTKNIMERTVFYSRNKHGQVVEAEPLDSSYKIPGGGWLSSAEDMAAFEVAMLEDKLVKPETRELMWTAQTLVNGKPTKYGYGWGIDTEDGMRTVSHSGGQQGTSTNILIVSEKKEGIVVLINSDHGDAVELSKRLLKVVLGTKDGVGAGN